MHYHSSSNDGVSLRITLLCTSFSLICVFLRNLRIHSPSYGRGCLLLIAQKCLKYLVDYVLPQQNHLASDSQKFGNVRMFLHQGNIVVA